MPDIREQIFQELSKLEDGVARLRATAVDASKQTDLEVAILTQQVRNLLAKNARAAELIDQAIGLFGGIK